MNIVRKLAQQSGMSIIDDEDVYCTLEQLDKFFDLVLDFKNKCDSTPMYTTFGLRPPVDKHQSTQDICLNITVKHQRKLK